jgi:Fibrobacter succinogenes major domain (Fib_succ_major).
LNYKTSDGNSRCYPTSGSTNASDADEGRCGTYGRLYNWSTAMDLPSKCNSTLSTSDAECAITTPNHQGICPSGWHIPSDADWNVLMKLVNPSCTDNSDCAGAEAKLKATSGWNGTLVSTNDFGFAALPGGRGNPDDTFGLASNYGYWWSASEYDSNYVYYREMGYNYNRVYYSHGYSKRYLHSVRCLQDSP